MGKRNGGFTLLETMVAIVILGAMVVPTCTALVMSIRINDKTEKMLQAQLAVSSAVEQLMAEGINAERANDPFTKEKGYVVIVETKTNHEGESATQETPPKNQQSETVEKDEYPDVRITVEQVEGQSYYKVVVADNAGLVEVVTHIRKAGGN
jgi:prepilin-type N-terminal cleavage/methylation domain-containing protein